MQVVVTDDAYRDLSSIHDYIAVADSEARADTILDRLLESTESLSRNPARGSRPHELVVLGRRDFRQLIVKPWRIIYRAESDRIVIYLIADGRRDMRSLLAQRLLDA